MQFSPFKLKPWRFIKGESFFQRSVYLFKVQNTEWIPFPWKIETFHKCGSFQACSYNMLWRNFVNITKVPFTVITDSKWSLLLFNGTLTSQRDTLHLLWFHTLRDQKEWKQLCSSNVNYRNENNTFSISTQRKTITLNRRQLSTIEEIRSSSVPWTMGCSPVGGVSHSDLARKTQNAPGSVIPILN